MNGSWIDGCETKHVEQLVGSAELHAQLVGVEVASRHAGQEDFLEVATGEDFGFGHERLRFWSVPVYHQNIPPQTATNIISAITIMPFTKKRRSSSLFNALNIAINAKKNTNTINPTILCHANVIIFFLLTFSFPNDGVPIDLFAQIS